LLAAQDEPEAPAPVRAPLIDELNCQLLKLASRKRRGKEIAGRLRTWFRCEQQSQL